MMLSPSASSLISHSLLFFFFHDTATTEIYTLSLHDALPIFGGVVADDEALALEAEVDLLDAQVVAHRPVAAQAALARQDRKSTRLNSSHITISYAVFCLKKKKTDTHEARERHTTANARQQTQ